MFDPEADIELGFTNSEVELGIPCSEFHLSFDEKGGYWFLRTKWANWTFIRLCENGKSFYTPWGDEDFDNKCKEFGLYECYDRKTKKSFTTLERPSSSLQLNGKWIVLYVKPLAKEEEQRHLRFSLSAFHYVYIDVQQRRK